MEQESSHLQRIREAFPSVLSGGYWNSGTCGPLPRCCVEAMQEAMTLELTQGRAAISGYLAFLEKQRELHAQMARLIGASAGEVIWTQHTTEGMNIALWGFPWQAGDQIITSNQEHMGLLAPLALLHQRLGVAIRYLRFTGDADADLALLSEAWTSQTKMVALSHVSYLDGRRFPIEALGAYCRARGVPLLLDAAQSLGVLPLDVDALGVDILAAPCQKWLCAPEGSGLLYIRESWHSRIQPTFGGSFGVRFASWIDQASPYYVPSEGAGRYLQGGRFRPMLAGLMASLRFLEEEAGWPWIFSRIPLMVKQTRTALESLKGIEILTPRGLEASLLSFRIQGHDALQIAAALEHQGIILRTVGTPPALRISVGFFHDDNDIHRLIEALRALIA